MPIIINHFPLFKRFTASSFLYALSRATIYILTSFGLIYLTESVGDSGILFILLPTIMGTTWSIYHFEKLEKQFETPTNAKEAGEKFIKSLTC